MPNLNKIDSIGDKAAEGIAETMLSVVDQTMIAYSEGERATIRAYYLTETTGITQAALLEGSSLGLGSQYVMPVVQDVTDYYMFSKYKTGNLSDRLNDNAKVAQNVVDKTVKQHIKAKTNWKKLGNDLTKKKISSKSDIPKYLQDLVDASKAINPDSKEIAKLAEVARKRIEKLISDGKGGTANLKNAYKNVVKAVEKGDVVALEKKLTLALDKKARYQADRLARNEISRAYFDGFNREMADDEDVSGWKSLLSPSHPRTDICDYYAEADQFGLGGGVYPKNYGNPIPHHVGCICMAELVYVDPFNKKKGKFSEKGGQEYIDNLSDKDKRAMFNVKDRENPTANNLRGFNSPINLHALPKDLVERV